MRGGSASEAGVAGLFVFGDALDFGASDFVNTLDLPVDFGGDFFGVVFLLQGQFDFDVYSGATHLLNVTMAFTSVLCRICEIRRPRRFCPGVHGDICAICCGTEREQTINCPLDCPYLEEARKHEEPPLVDGRTFPNNDIKVTEDFLRKHEGALLWVSVALLRAALETPGVIDYDIRETLEALVKTYRTLQSGLVYESRPTNPLAAGVYERVQAGVDEYRGRAAEAGTGEHLRDAEVLGILAFLQRMEIQQNNGRKKGRAFVDFLRLNFPQTSPAEAPPSLIL